MNLPVIWAFSQFEIVQKFHNFYALKTERNKELMGNSCPDEKGQKLD
jgi:hypothetical protein